jgi:hypothetical protein
MSILINSYTKVICQGLIGEQNAMRVGAFQTCDLIEPSHSNTHILCNCGNLS